MRSSGVSLRDSVVARVNVIYPRKREEMKDSPRLLRSKTERIVPFWEGRFAGILRVFAFGRILAIPANKDVAEGDTLTPHF